LPRAPSVSHLGQQMRLKPNHITSWETPPEIQYVLAEQGDQPPAEARLPPANALALRYFNHAHNYRCEAGPTSLGKHRGT
jgi:hypothetical protein